jgi:hypothetical protein
MSEVLSHDTDQLPDDEQKKLTVLTYTPQVTFHWPPDYLWPFTDRGDDGTYQISWRIAP